MFLLDQHVYQRDNDGIMKMSLSRKYCSSVQKHDDKAYVDLTNTIGIIFINHDKRKSESNK